MVMSRQFKSVDYEATLETSVRLGDCLPPEHLSRFVVDIVAQLDCSEDAARVNFHLGIKVLRLNLKAAPGAKDGADEKPPTT